MADPRVSNLARTLVNYCVEVKEKDLVGIIAQPPATPLVGEVLRHVLRSGGYPYLLPYTYPYPHSDMKDLTRFFLRKPVTISFSTRTGSGKPSMRILMSEYLSTASLIHAL